VIASCPGVPPPLGRRHRPPAATVRVGAAASADPPGRRQGISAAPRAGVVRPGRGYLTVGRRGGAPGIVVFDQWQAGQAAGNSLANGMWRRVAERGGPAGATLLFDLLTPGEGKMTGPTWCSTSPASRGAWAEVTRMAAPPSRAGRAHAGAIRLLFRASTGAEGPALGRRPGPGGRRPAAISPGRGLRRRAAQDLGPHRDRRPSKRADAAL